MDNSAVIAAARAWVGRPCERIGCLGLMQRAFAPFDLLGSLDAPNEAALRMLGAAGALQRVEQHWQLIEQPVPACLLLMRFSAVGFSWHLALYTDSGTIIHANDKRGRVVEHGYRAHWVRWTHSQWLIPVRAL